MKNQWFIANELQNHAPHSPWDQTQQTWLPGMCRPHSNSQHPPVHFGRAKIEVKLKNTAIAIALYTKCVWRLSEAK